MKSSDVIDEQTGITEITIGVDGCVYVFGLSRQVLEILATLAPDDPRVRQLMDSRETVEMLRSENYG